MNRAENLIQAAKRAGLKIATAESCTGGLIAGALTDIPGSSAVLERGFVTYSNEAKIDMLAVASEAIEEQGAVSNTVVRAMVAGALKHSRADLAVAVTGIAGPNGGTEQKPVGLVYIAVKLRDGLADVKECRFGDIGRKEIRTQTVNTALDMLLAQVGN